MTLNVRDQVRQLESRINELGTRTPETPVSTPAPGAVTPAEPVAPAVEPAAVAPPPVAPAPATSTTLEEKFGTQWVVWIGGLALALGGIFLVRFTIEQGLLGPGVRIFLAGVFSALLIAAGEWARRNEIAAGIAAIPKQHIPSRLLPAIAAGAARFSRRRCADNRADRNIPRPVVHRAWCSAGMHRLALPAHAVPSAQERDIIGVTAEAAARRVTWTSAW